MVVGVVMVMMVMIVMMVMMVAGCVVSCGRTRGSIAVNLRT